MPVKINNWYDLACRNTSTSSNRSIVLQEQTLSEQQTDSGPNAHNLRLIPRSNRVNRLEAIDAQHENDSARKKTLKQQNKSIWHPK